MGVRVRERGSENAGRVAANGVVRQSASADRKATARCRRTLADADAESASAARLRVFAAWDVVGGVAAAVARAGNRVPVGL